MICITVQLLFNQIHIKWFHYAFLFIKHTFTYIKGEDMGSSRRDVSRVLVTSISERVPFYTTADFIIILWNQCTKIWSYHRMILFTQRRKYIYKGQKQTKSDKKGHQRPNAVTGCTYGKSPHSTGLRLLLGPLPKKKNDRKSEERDALLFLSSSR